MRIAYLITHAEVVIDPSIPVPEWPLSPEGIRRTKSMLRQSWVASLRAVFTSAERKAMDTARLLAGYLSVAPIVFPDLGENDRSATGYLPKFEFEAVADHFFARPHESVRGWERAADAQRRIVAAIEQVIAATPAEGDIAIVSHGGVGALLLCHLKGVPISRAEDQPGNGGGNVFSFDMGTRQLLTGWRPIDG